HIWSINTFNVYISTSIFKGDMYCVSKDLDSERREILQYKNGALVSRKIVDNDDTPLRYEEYHNGQIHGSVCELIPNGDIIVTEYKNGKRDGKYTYEHNSGYFTVREYK